MVSRLKRRNKYKNAIRKITIGAILPVTLLALWEYFGRKGVINQSILPKPSTLWEALEYMTQSGDLQKHLLISIVRVVKGFTLGALVGLTGGAIIGLSKFANEFFAALIGILRPIPIIAWVPMLILWMGIDEASKETLIAIGSFWPILLNTIRGIQNADKKLLEVAHILEKNKRQILIKVIIPSALPSVFTGIRLGVGAAWSCVVAAEMIAAAKGIGYLIMYSRELSQPDIMLVGVFSIGIIGLLIDAVLIRIEKRVLRWNMVEE
jgi:sulfonate transport system permease protein